MTPGETNLLQCSDREVVIASHVRARSVSDLSVRVKASERFSGLKLRARDAAELRRIKASGRLSVAALAPDPDA
jgi:hypothetical protein